MWLLFETRCYRLVSRCDVSRRSATQRLFCNNTPTRALHCYFGFAAVSMP